MEKIILISGKAFNGKTKAGDYLQKQFESKGKKVARLLYAGYLKELLIKYYGWDGITKNDYWRGKLQNLGTDRIRKELNKPLFHVGRIAEDIEIIFNDFDIVIIDDTRFKNEIYYMKALFPDITETIRVYRVGFESPLTLEQQQHDSETNLDGFTFDYNIYVQSGLAHLHDEIDRMFKGKWY